MAPAALLWLAFLPSLSAQGNVLTAVAPPKTVGVRNGILTAKVSVQLRDGFHVNSHAPNDEYLIPMRLTWEATPLQVLAVDFPKPVLENYEFSNKPVSVFTGDFDVVSRFKVPANAPLGPGSLAGKLRYQACNNSMCLPPKTVTINLPIDIRAK